ncbi:MAG: diguanylate cyclase [Nannocystaceae bacterium]|nr:sensor domain-containing diguanylate cyclase [bacterium]
MLDQVLPALTELARGVQRRASLDENLQQLVDETARLFRASHASVRLLDPSHTQLVAACRSGPSVHPRPVEFQPGEGLVGWIVEHGEPLRVADPASDPRFVPKPGFSGMGPFVGAPLLSSNVCLGALSVVRDEPFSATEEQLLELIAAICAPPLEIARLSRLSRLDPLTGALNRRGLEEGYAPEAAPTGEKRVAVLMVDIDHFKSINDAHGHLVGDEVLRRIARQLSCVLRTSDAIVRYGGEEFLLLLADVTLDEAMAVSERARRAIESQTIRVTHVPLRVTVSTGVAMQRTDEPLGAAVERADAALYRAKRDGRNRVLSAT